MTDAETVDAARRSLFPLRVDKVPSEAVFWELPGEPFWLHESQPGVPGASPVTVWLEGVDFAVSGTKACRDQGVGYELFETHEELVAAVAADLA